MLWRYFLYCLAFEFQFFSIGVSISTVYGYTANRWGTRRQTTEETDRMDYRLQLRLTCHSPNKRLFQLVIRLLLEIKGVR
jgi:hypothetical protein